MDMAAENLEVRGRTRERDAAEEAEATTSAAMDTPAVKRRKLQGEVDGESTVVSSPCVQEQLTNSGGTVARDLAEPPEIVGRTFPAGDHCQSPNSEDHLGGASISCCSSNGFSEKMNGRIEFLDLEEHNVAETGTTRHHSCSTRSQTSAYCEQQEESDSMGSASAAGEEQPSDAAESRRRSRVTEAELEDFFMAAEKDLRKKIFECSRKYNFDFVKEEALDGRFEWVKLKP